MFKKFIYLFIVLLAGLAHTAWAQIPDRPYGRDTMRTSGTKLTDAQLLDTLRAREENKKDSVVYNSKFVKVTNERLLKDSTQVFPLDTTLTNFENYSPLYQPRSPRIGLGNLGLPQRTLLFEPAKTVGFDVGQHMLDLYMMGPQDINYYRARVAYTNLYFVGGGQTEQVFKLVHSQNIKPNWNVGANFNSTGSRGYYNKQNVSDLNAAVFTWYESKGKRYNLLANITFNNIKAPESGAILRDTIFSPNFASFDKLREAVRLNASKISQENNTIYLKQFYYIGRIDTIVATGNDAAKFLPTQRVAHTISYNTSTYKFLQNEADASKVFPDYYFNPTISQDSLRVTDLRNEFSYSFYLRGKSVSFVKNEVKLDLGITHDLYSIRQSINDSLLFNTLLRNQKHQVQSEAFQNIKLNAKFSYRFSDKAALEGDFQQVVVGRNFGDYLYDAKLSLAGGAKAGRIVLGAYAQNNAAPLIYSNWISNHYVFRNTGIGQQKINNVSFNYMNDKLLIDLKAEYFLVTGYQYFAAQSDGGIDAAPAQLSSPLNMLKVSIGKTIKWRRFTFEDYFVYQKSDYQSTIRTPEIYNYANAYYSKLLFSVLNTTLGVNVRYNTTYVAPSYAVGIGQFYNGANVTFTSYPYITPYVKATLYRTNLLLQYDYANQYLQSNGFYTVNRYPMQDRLLKFGVSWTFYN